MPTLAIPACSAEGRPQKGSACDLPVCILSRRRPHQQPHFQRQRKCLCRPHSSSTYHVQRVTPSFSSTHLLLLPEEWFLSSFCGSFCAFVPDLLLLPTPSSLHLPLCFQIFSKHWFHQLCRFKILKWHHLSPQPIPSSQWGMKSHSIVLLSVWVEALKTWNGLKISDLEIKFVATEAAWGSTQKIWIQLVQIQTGCKVRDIPKDEKKVWAPLTQDLTRGELVFPLHKPNCDGFGCLPASAPDSPDSCLEELTLCFRVWNVMHPTKEACNKRGPWVGGDSEKSFPY